MGDNLQIGPLQFSQSDATAPYLLQLTVYMPDAKHSTDHNTAVPLTVGLRQDLTLENQLSIIGLAIDALVNMRKALLSGDTGPDPKSGAVKA